MTSTYVPDRVCPGLHGDHPAVGAPIWCDAHHTLIDTALTRLTGLVDALTVNGDGSLPQGRTVTDRVPSRGVSLPSPSPAFDAIDHVTRWVRSWVDTAAAVLDDPDRRDAVWTPSVLDATHYLQDHLDRLLRVEGIAVPLGTQILTTTDRVEKQAGMERLRVRMPVPCPRCDRRSLAREDGTSIVQCSMRDCGAMWPDQVWQRITIAVARHQREKATA